MYGLDAETEASLNLNVGDDTATRANLRIVGQMQIKHRGRSIANTDSIVTDGTSFLSEIQKARQSAEADGSAAALARKTAETTVLVTTQLADKSATVDGRIAEYEKRLAELELESRDKLKTIVGLLPGATSAGLAHAFDQRRQTFLAPHRLWQWAFVLSVMLIVGLTGTGLWHVIQSATAPSYDELIRLWLSRLPVTGALVWLALYASRESALAKRLKEDYGYKSAIAACFEGFQRQMSEVQAAASLNSPLATLCDNTLKTIATPPGRIYEGHALAVSPSEEVKEVAGTVLRGPSVPNNAPQ